MKLKRLFLLLIVVLIGIFLRFFELSKFPIQLNHDEISQIYDVASIAQTKKDIYGNFLPLAFPSTGEFKVGHYIYISVLPYLIFGAKEFTIRIPSAFFGSLTILAVFLFINILTKKWKLALLSSFMVAITPSEIFYSRKSFENVIGIFFVFFGLYLLFKQLETKEINIKSYITPFPLALAMYIYTSHTMTIPLTLILFAIIFWKKILLFRKKFVSLLIIWFILILPLIYIILTNEGIKFRARSVSILQDGNLNRQLEYVQSDNNLVSILYKYKTIFDYGFDRYLKQLNPSYLFANGLDLTNQGLLGLGPLMIMQLPFVIFGIIFMLRSTSFLNEGKFLLLLFLIDLLPSGITFEPFSPHRAEIAFVIISIISAFGIYYFVKLLINLNQYTLVKKISLLLLITLFLLNFIYCIHIYTINFPYEKSQYMHYPFKQLAVFAWSKVNSFDQIIIDPTYGQAAPTKAVAVHYYLAYYGQYSPEKFQEDLKIDKEGMKFNKFSIREINWGKDQSLKNTLIIASPWQIPVNSIDKNKIIQTFYFYDHQPAFYAIKL